jgi:hypothetical protein
MFLVLIEGRYLAQVAKVIEDEPAWGDSVSFAEQLGIEGAAA